MRDNCHALEDISGVIILCRICGEWQPYSLAGRQLMTEHMKDEHPG